MRSVHRTIWVCSICIALPAMQSISSLLVAFCKCVTWSAAVTTIRIAYTFANNVKRLVMPCARTTCMPVPRTCCWKQTTRHSCLRSRAAGKVCKNERSTSLAAVVLCSTVPHQTAQRTNHRSRVFIRHTDGITNCQTRLLTMKPAQPSAMCCGTSACGRPPTM